MSNFFGGKDSIRWRNIWDGLFWRFMHKQQDFFKSNPRIGMLLKTWDGMDSKKQQEHLNNAQLFLTSLK